MLLTRQTDYAARALVFLTAHKERFCSSTEIAETEEIPILFLRRILVRLAAMGIVESREGAWGGVRLIRDPKKIKLYGLIKEFQGDFKISECILNKNLCPNNSKCMLRRRLSVMEERLVGEIKSITLNDLVFQEAL